VVQGIAALVSGGIVDAAQSDELVADAIAQFRRDPPGAAEVRRRSAVSRPRSSR
jgi:hypothetical protein